MESAAFTCHDREKLIATGLHYIQHNARMTEAFTNVHKWWDELHDVKAVREQVLAHYLSDNLDGCDDQSVLHSAGLAGRGGDFGRSICLASSLGYDADCTCATLGAILGLIDPDGIEEKWSRPIGNQLVLSDNIIAMHEPPTISEFIALVGDDHAGGQPLLRRIGSVAAGKRTSRMAWRVSMDEAVCACGGAGGYRTGGGASAGCAAALAGGIGHLLREGASRGDDLHQRAGSAHGGQCDLHRARGLAGCSRSGGAVPCARCVSYPDADGAKPEAGLSLLPQYAGYAFPVRTA